MSLSWVLALVLHPFRGTYRLAGDCDGGGCDCISKYLSESHSEAREKAQRLALVTSVHPRRCSSVAHGTVPRPSSCYCRLDRRSPVGKRISAESLGKQSNRSGRSAPALSAGFGSPQGAVSGPVRPLRPAANAVSCPLTGPGARNSRFQGAESTAHAVCLLSCGLLLSPFRVARSCLLSYVVNPPISRGRPWLIID